jgi:hypothetical protein
MGNNNIYHIINMNILNNINNNIYIINNYTMDNINKYIIITINFINNYFMYVSFNIIIIIIM